MSGFPILMGVSRKSFIGHVLDAPVEERLEGTAACVAACVLKGANIVRVHDVKFMRGWCGWRRRYVMPNLKTSDFDFDLPPERIAQYAIEPRDARVCCA